MAEAAGSARYGFGSRLAHRIAFAHPAIQRSLADVEESSLPADYGPPRLTRPVFITGLPRAGTTLLLDLLYATGEFASHTYRQMPFVLAPVLWDRLTAGGRDAAVSLERLHGDGMSVSTDSPEAFEEVLWLNWLRRTIIGENCLNRVVAADLSHAFRTGFIRSTARLVGMVERREGRSLRYLSKNNANIARLDTLIELCPDATIIIALRDPLEQARSLDAQHRRFTAMHAVDRFGKDYMRWIGHHDFGANFLPQDFGAGALDVPERPDIRFWLEYWRQAYSFVRDHAGPNCVIVSHEALRADPVAVLGRLALRLGTDPAGLAGQAPTLRPPTPGKAAPEAQRLLYEELTARSV